MWLKQRVLPCLECPWHEDSVASQSSFKLQLVCRISPPPSAAVCSLRNRFSSHMFHSRGEQHEDLTLAFFFSPQDWRPLEGGDEIWPTLNPQNPHPAKCPLIGRYSLNWIVERLAWFCCVIHSRFWGASLTLVSLSVTLGYTSCHAMGRLWRDNMHELISSVWHIGNIWLVIGGY